MASAVRVVELGYEAVMARTEVVVEVRMTGLWKVRLGLWLVRLGTRIAGCRVRLETT